MYGGAQLALGLGFTHQLYLAPSPNASSAPPHTLTGYIATDDYMYTCMYMYMYIYSYIYIHILYIYICLSLSISLLIFIYNRRHFFAPSLDASSAPPHALPGYIATDDVEALLESTRIYMYRFVDIYVCMYVCIYTCMVLYIRVHQGPFPPFAGRLSPPTTAPLLCPFSYNNARHPHHLTPSVVCCVKRSTCHTHTHRQRTAPPTPTHIQTTRTTPQTPKRTAPTNT